MKKLPCFEDDIALSLSTWVEIMKSFNKIRSLELEFIEANSLTIGQFGVLELLYHRGAQSVGAATKLAMTTPGNMTVIVKNLSKRGLIVAQKSDDDKRSATLCLTNEGSNLIASMFPEHSRRINSFLSGLTAEEKEVVRALLRKLNKSL